MENRLQRTTEKILVPYSLTCLTFNDFHEIASVEPALEYLVLLRMF